jgi:hemerythrin-like domain-containing protein
MRATRVLRDEHRVILSVLDAFAIALRRARASGRADRADFDPFLDFFGRFSDGCHHRKEEERLFALLEERGCLVPGSPVAVMLDEHERGRALRDGMAAALAAGESGAEGALDALLGNGADLAELLRRHIDKEEHCLFGMAEREIRGADLERLLHAYAESERDPAYREDFEHGWKEAERLAARYGLPPVPRPVAAESLVASAAAPPPRRAARAPAPEARPWQAWAAQLAPGEGSELARRVERALASPAVAMQRAMLERVGLRVGEQPILWKDLPSGHLRLFFPVSGESAELAAGSIVALVLLYDLAREETLYAHPVHAGPEANPLLKHLGGPMAHPRAQEGENGELATRRLLQHKAALWEAFEAERERLGAEEAGRRWRERYGWSLVRLYFCERCSACRWGDPSYEGAGGPRCETVSVAPAAPSPDARAPGWEVVADAIRASDAFRVEVAYAARGRFAIAGEPRLAARVDGEWWVAIFPSDVELVEGGSLAGVAAWHHAPSGATPYVHCLPAGPEAELLFLHGDRALGLPLARIGEDARQAYAAWRRSAWSRFWLDELELGRDAASRRWLEGWWAALGRLVGARDARIEV